MTLKICDITQFYSPRSGGVRRYVEERQRYINSTGKHQQVLIVPGDRNDSTYCGRSVVYRIHSPRIERTCDYRVIINLERVREIIQRENPDIIECADPYQLAWMILDHSRELKIPAVAFYHSHFPETCFGFARRFGVRLASSAGRYAQMYAAHLYNKFRQTLVPSSKLACLLASWGVENAVAVSLGVDTTTFKPGNRNETRRRELMIGADQTLLLYVGRLSQEKNLQTLVQAFALLDDTSPSRFRLHLIGEGPLKEDLLHIARARPGITVQSYVSDSAELAQHYLAADIFVHPGINETFGLVTLEAQACGVPVMGIRGTFMDRLALSGAGHWSTENSPEALAAAIYGFTSMPLRTIGGIAARVAHQQYSWPKVFGRLFDLYEKVLPAS